MSDDDELIYASEIGNAHDTHAVALWKNINRDTRTVGCIPRKIISLCLIFIRRGGMICCKVNGHQRHSYDLPQGGLEAPCILTFITREEWAKTKELIQSVLDI